ncbi:alpha-ketoglutarate-dependent dioxygenase alkB 2 [Naviculisporaceae sp. PSN 640]
MFDFNLAAVPSISTRKALIIIDLQNDFVGPDAVLPVVEPEGFVSRTLDLVRTFRNSGAGDVIWVRSEFQRHRALTSEGEQIITSDLPQRPSTTSRMSSRGRQPSSRPHDGALMEMDEESFLSVSQDSDKPICVRKGTKGAEFPPQVQEAIDSRDIVFTKYHYSAFAQQELVQMLRGRLVTEMYVCGSLTNIGIYATALDAGRHGYEMTLVEDCCGFRNEMRHVNAVRQLMQLVGSEAMNAESVIEKLQPPKPKTRRAPEPPAPRTSSKSQIEKTELGSTDAGSGSGRGQPQVPYSTSASTGLSPSLSKASLSRSHDSPAATSPPQPTEEHVSTTGQAQGKSSGATGEVQTTTLDRPSFWVDNDAPLEADSDPESDTSSPELLDFDKVVRESRYRGSAAAEMRARIATQTQPVTAAASERTTIRMPVRTKRRVRDSSDTPESSPGKQDKIPGAQPPTSSSSSQGRATQNPGPEPDQPASATKRTKMAEQTEQQPQAGPAPIFTKPICEGDTTIILSALSPDLASTAFDRLLTEVSWAGMSRMGGEVPRRIAVQGEVDEHGNMPVYRHPADESPPLLPFSPTVEAIKTEIERHLGHPLNHVLIQHYRSGNDYISEHSDKTLDIVPSSYIANVSLGAERTMVFRTKRPAKNSTSPDKDNDKDKEKSVGPSRQIERAPLPHNSLCRMGLKTNMRWLHAIRQDKRLDKEKSAEELAYNGQRISLTFRQIGTFLDRTQTKIWGQGAVSKEKDSPGEVINGQEHEETVKLLKAFGAENNSSEFDWAEKYGSGFNVLHMGSPKRLCTGPGTVQNMRVRLAILETGIGSCAAGSVDGDAVSVRFEDNDPGRATIDGDGSILRYLDAVYGPGRRYDTLPAVEIARRFGRLQAGLDLLGIWRGAKKKVGLGLEEEKRVLIRQLGKVKDFKAALGTFEAWARESALALTLTASTKNTKPTSGETGEAKAMEGESSAGGDIDDLRAFFIAGGEKPSPADFALWPVLEDIVRVFGVGVFELGVDKVQSSSGSYLARYYNTFGARTTVKKVVEAESQSQGDKVKAKA